MLSGSARKSLLSQCRRASQGLLQQGGSVRIRCQSQYAGGLSSSSSSSPLPGGIPSYSVYGENCMLSLRAILPQFRALKNDTLVVDKKGRMLLEWLPRNASGTLSDRESTIRLGLSPEEIGLLLDQLPQHEVELVRTASQPGFGGSDGPSSVGAPDKIFRVTPGTGGTVTFRIEFDQGMSGGTMAPRAPLEVTVQLGEFKVMYELMRSSIPALVGWSTLLDLALQKNVAETGQQRSFGRGYPNPGGSQLPF